MNISIDAAARGVLMAKPIDNAQQQFEDIVSNNYHWRSEQGQLKRERRHEIDAFTMLASKVYVLFQKVEWLQPTLSQSDAPSRLYNQVSICEVCGV